MIPVRTARRVTLSDGRVIDASLLIAADGAKSKLRERAGIATHGWDYDQSGIVVTVGHERDHQGRAEETLSARGSVRDPAAERQSLVAGLGPKAAAKPRASSNFLTANSRPNWRHGSVCISARWKALDKPRAFPLGYFVARSFIAERLALVGDAAHVIHPIAGQGLNMGLKDAAALAEVIVDAARLGIDPGQADVLERYQRWRVSTRWRWVSPPIR